MVAGDVPAAPVVDQLAADKPPSDNVTGLTPEQVLQELKKSGYVDQLRRQMFDAFTASASTSTASASAAAAAAADVFSSQAATSASTHVPSYVTPMTNDAASPPTTTSVPSTTNHALPPSTAPTTTPAAAAAAAATPLNIAPKPAFLSFLSTPLRTAVENDHANLRSSDQRGQHDTLLKALESDPVAHPDREILGEATVYDLLVRHLVSGQPAGGATAGLLAREGRIGRDACARIAELIDDMAHPSSKEGEADDDDDHDQDETEEAQQVAQTQHDAGRISAAETHSQHNSAQPLPTAMDHD